MIYDFHSHVLPGVDHGAKNMDMSLQMLRKSAEMGVEAVVATSHCYPTSEKGIERFIEERDRVFDLLPLDNGMPKLYKGCEVHLTGDLSELSNIDRLCIENTRYMLLEMPTYTWTDNVVENVYKLTLKKILPIIAHDERNMNQPAEFRDALHDLDVLIQVNSDSFGQKVFKKEIDRLMRIGMLHIVGSDMHDMTERKPGMDVAQSVVTKRYGADCWAYLMHNAERILNGEKISYRDFRTFSKKSILRKK